MTVEEMTKHLAKQAIGFYGLTHGLPEDNGIYEATGELSSTEGQFSIAVFIVDKQKAGGTYRSVAYIAGRAEPPSD